jgi:hypothetical protein
MDKMSHYQKCFSTRKELIVDRKQIIYDVNVWAHSMKICHINCCFPVIKPGYTFLAEDHEICCSKMVLKPSPGYAGVSLSLPKTELNASWVA